MHWRTYLFLIIDCLISTCSAEWALVNLIRHGERYNEKTHGGHLHPYGIERAEYIAKCVMDPAPTLAFPLGRPSRLLASYGHHSTRPKETLEPLERDSGIKLDFNIAYDDVDAFKKYVHELHHGQTLFVAWQHQQIPKLVKAFVGNMAKRRWPAECPYNEWIEPDEIQHGGCYDAVWQMALHRENHSEPWQPQAFAQMHAGFAGSRHSPCSQAFRPHSNPTHWNYQYKVYQPPESSGQPGVTMIPDASQVYSWLFGFASASLLWALLWAKKVWKIAHGDGRHEPLLQ